MFGKFRRRNQILFGESILFEFLFENILVLTNDYIITLNQCILNDDCELYIPCKGVWPKRNIK